MSLGSVIIFDVLPYKKMLLPMHNHQIAGERRRRMDLDAHLTSSARASSFYDQGFGKAVFIDPAKII